MEKIIKIEEATFKKGKDDWSSYDGYLIATDKQIIKMGICNGQNCCENWGYFMSNDNIKEFEEAAMTDITITDTCLNVKKLKDAELYEPNLMFVNINTDKGLLQFVAYNSHNGYYGHDAVVISEQLNHEERL